MKEQKNNRIGAQRKGTFGPKRDGGGLRSGIEGRGMEELKETAGGKKKKLFKMR